MKIANKIGLSFFLVGFVLCTIAATYFYEVCRHNLLNAIENNLVTAAVSRTRHVETYLAATRIFIGQLSKSSALEQFLKFDDKTAPGYSDAFAQGMKRLRRTKEANPSVTEFFLMDRQGRVVASSRDESLGRDLSTDALFLGGKQGVYLKDVFYSPEDNNEPVLSSSVPFLDSRNGELLGVLALKARLNELNNIVTEHAGLGRTGEIYIVNKYGFMITSSRFTQDAVLKQKINVEEIKKFLAGMRREPASPAASATLIYTDYRGKSVLGTFHDIPQLDWTLLAEIDITEAFAPLAKLRLAYILIVIIVPFASWWLGGILAVFITQPLEQLRVGTEIFASGNFDHRVDIKTKDEVGKLAQAFNAMADNIKKTTISLDELNKEIAERQKAEAGIVASEEKFRRLFEYMTSGVAIYKAVDDGADFVFHDLNPGAEKIDQVGKAEILGKRITECFPGVKEFGLLNLLQRVWKTGKSEHLGEKFYEDGRISGWRDNRVYKLPSGEVVVVYEDISERMQFVQKLQEMNSELETRVTQRTADLEKANQTLQALLEEQGRTEGALRDSNDRYQKITSSITDYIYTVYLENGQPVKTIHSSTCEAVIGYAPQEFVARPNLWLEMVPKEDRAPLLERIERFISGGKGETLEHRIIHKDGRTIWVKNIFVPYYDAHGRLQSYDGVVSDITERKQFQEQIVKRNEFLNSILAALNHPFYVVDVKSYKVIMGNAASGYSGQDITCHALTHKAEQPCQGSHLCPLQEVERTKMPITVEHIHYGKDNKPGYFEVHGYPIFDDKGNVIQMLEYSLNITERKIAEGQVEEETQKAIQSRQEAIDALNGLKRSQAANISILANLTRSKQHLEEQSEELKKALAVKNEFTSTVSHELRTPLAISKEALSLILRGKLGQISEKQKEIILMASSNIDRLATLINDVLDASKMEAGKMELHKEVIDVVQIVRESCGEWMLRADTKKIEFAFETGNQSLMFPVDKMRFIQILSNLISNAVKFTPEHGKITVRIEEREEAVEFSVKDTGPGIAENDIPRLFQKFQQLKRTYGPGLQGTGLGLSIVKSLVELHGGQVSVRSELGQGTTFIFILPKLKSA